MLSCCKAEKHGWERFYVERSWLPAMLRCLIVGENPGGPSSEYFYERPVSYESDEVDVRKGLLRGLREQRLIGEPTLEGFRDAGFLFDHAIRCQLDPGVVRSEREKAKRYACKRVENPDHLRPWVARAPVVWVMGHRASNAVANATRDFPKQKRKISMPPYPAELARGSRFFLSEYLTWRTQVKASAFAEAFAEFGRQRRVFGNV